MTGFTFESGGKKCIRPILEKYQSGESEGYTVKTREEDIAISEYPLLQTEFLYEQKEETVFENFHSDDNKINLQYNTLTV